VSGFGRIVLIGAVAATVAGIANLRAQTQLVDPKDAHRIFASTCSACHKSPQGLAKSGQVAGFLRQHYTTGPEMSAAMAAYLVAAGSAPAAKKGQAEAKAGQLGENPAAKAKSKKQEQAAVHAGAPAERGVDGKDRRTLRGKQQHVKQDEAAVARPAAPTEVAPHPAITPAAAATAALTEPRPEPATTPEPAPPVVVLDLPLPEMPSGPPADLTQSAFSSSPLP
jgi:hypothetical protein